MISRATSPEELEKIGFPAPKGTILKNSWVEVDSTRGVFSCGRSTEFHSAYITVMTGGALTIGDGCIIRGRIIVAPGVCVTIGHGLICNSSIRIHTAEGGNIKIGNECLFANPEIRNSDMHAIFDDATGSRINLSRDVIIGDRVWLATNTLILKGTQLGSDSVAGAGAVISRVFPPKVVIAGNPGKVVREGITWSRTMLDKRPIDFGPHFSISSFRASAVALKHEDVINTGLPYIDMWPQLDSSNYFVFYYLARAIIEIHFKKNKIKTSLINGKEVSISTLSEIFEHIYSKIPNQYAAGSYAYLTHLIQGNTERAEAMYLDISAKWHGISGFKSKIPYLATTN